jgi:hypothetical protein
MINVSLVENQIVSSGKKKEIQKRIAKIKKPKKLSDFKTFLLSEFKTDKPYYITIYLIDSNGETNEIKDEEEYEDNDSVAFKVVYDETNVPRDERDNNSIKSENNEREENNNISLNSIDENELTLLLNEELKDIEKEEPNEFDSNILLNEYLTKQEELLKKTQLKINQNIEDIMVEKSKIFTDLTNIPQIQESIIGTTKKVIEVSNISKSRLMRQLTQKKGKKEEKEVKEETSVDTNKMEVENNDEKIPENDENKKE